MNLIRRKGIVDTMINFAKNNAWHVELGTGGTIGQQSQVYSKKEYLVEYFYDDITHAIYEVGTNLGMSIDQWKAKLLEYV